MKGKDKKEQSNKDLALIYEGQSDSFARVNYKGPTGKEDSWEAKAHTDGPGCYGCCGTKCLISFIAIIVIAVVCCAYTSGPNKTCAEFCYWPF